MCGVFAGPSLRAREGNVTVKSNSLNASIASNSASGLKSSWPHPGCCNGCNSAFCSPQSGTCYNIKGKYYYLQCGAGPSPAASCCNGCNTAFCSPQSGSCYNHKGKYYYLQCEADADCCRNCGGLCDPTSGQCTFEREYNDQLDCRVYIPRGYKYCPLPVDDGKIDSSPRVSSAKDCEDACRNTRGCLQFQFYNPTTADCDGIPACQLLSKDCYYQYRASSCWEAYSRD